MTDMTREWGWRLQIAVTGYKRHRVKAWAMNEVRDILSLFSSSLLSLLSVLPLHSTFSLLLLFYHSSSAQVWSNSHSLTEKSVLCTKWVQHCNLQITFPPNSYFQVQWTPLMPSIPGPQTDACSSFHSGDTFQIRDVRDDDEDDDIYPLRRTFSVLFLFPSPIRNERDLIDEKERRKEKWISYRERIFSPDVREISLIGFQLLLFPPINWGTHTLSFICCTSCQWNVSQ